MLTDLFNYIYNYFSLWFASPFREKNITEHRKQNLHPWVRADQAIRPLPTKTLSILVGLALKTDISVQSQLIKLETSERFGLF